MRGQNITTVEQVKYIACEEDYDDDGPFLCELGYGTDANEAAMDAMDQDDELLVACVYKATHKGKTSDVVVKEPRDVELYIIALKEWHVFSVKYAYSFKRTYSVELIGARVGDDAV